MKREEQIKKQADIYTDDASNYAKWSDDGGWSENNDIELVEKAFIEGAEWADKTMIDKACEWLKEVFVYLSNESSWNIQTNDYNSFQEMIEDFRKVMIGE